MHPIAHHMGEQALAPLLLLGGSWLTMRRSSAGHGWRPPAPS